MADLEAYRDKFGESGQRVLQNALGESKRRDQNYIAVEHIISALAKEEPDLFNSTIRSLALDPDLVTRAIDNRLDSSRQHIGKGSRTPAVCLSRCCGIWARSRKPSSNMCARMLTSARNRKSSIARNLTCRPT